MNYGRMQAWVLRGVGIVEAMAIVAVVMPRSWMAGAYVTLGFGAMPQTPVFDSVMRQVSFSYFMHGIALWFIADDVTRYRPLVWLSGFGYLIAAPVFVAVDLSLGLPWWWWLGNGGSCLLVGLIILCLLWRERVAHEVPRGRITI